MGLIGCPDPGPKESIAPIKLAGELFGHLGGFLEEGWRRNDYIWGRLDAAECILDLLIHVYGSDEPGFKDERARHLICLQKEILADEYTRYTCAARPPIPPPNTEDPKANRPWIGRGNETVLSLPPERIRQTLQYLVNASLGLARGSPLVATWSLDWASRILRALSMILRPVTWLIPGDQASRAWGVLLMALLLFGSGFLVGHYTVDALIAAGTNVLVATAGLLFVFTLGAVAGWRLWLLVPAAFASGMVVALWVWREWLAEYWQVGEKYPIIVTAFVVALFLLVDRIVVGRVWPRVYGWARVRIHSPWGEDRQASMRGF